MYMGETGNKDLEEFPPSYDDAMLTGYRTQATSGAYVSQPPGTHPHFTAGPFFSGVPGSTLSINQPILFINRNHHINTHTTHLHGQNFHYTPNPTRKSGPLSALFFTLFLIYIVSFQTFSVSDGLKFVIEYSSVTIFILSKLQIEVHPH